MTKEILSAEYAALLDKVAMALHIVSPMSYESSSERYKKAQRISAENFLKRLSLNGCDISDISQASEKTIVSLAREEKDAEDVEWDLHIQSLHKAIRKVLGDYGFFYATGSYAGFEDVEMNFQPNNHSVNAGKARYPLVRLTLKMEKSNE